MLQKDKELILIKGAGDLASGVAYRLYRAGFDLVMVEKENPTVVRRGVSFAQAAFDGKTEVEGITCEKTELDPQEISAALDRGVIPLLIDPDLNSLKSLKPTVLIEATLSKKNTGISKDMAEKVIALGPGYRAGIDVHAVIETARGHYLGRTIYQGEAQENTGIPGNIAGYTSERVIRAPGKGRFKTNKQIGDEIETDEIIGYVEPVEMAGSTRSAESKESIGSTGPGSLEPTGSTESAKPSAPEKAPGSDLVPIPVKTEIGGVIRGLLHDGLKVKEGMKLGDIDPRAKVDHCYTISDKALAIAGGVLEAVLAPRI